tara:strand:+ start:168 stop:482 length:315 start_codon:yes stop_codon:yes gene_type:complete
MKALVLAKYAPPALKGLISGSDREAAVRKLMDAVGGNADYIAFVRGKYDVVARFEVGDQETAIGLVLAVKASGAFEEVDYLEEVDMTRVVHAAQTASSAYAPAG